MEEKKRQIVLYLTRNPNTDLNRISHYVGSKGLKEALDELINEGKVQEVNIRWSPFYKLIYKKGEKKLFASRIWRGEGYYGMLRFHNFQRTNWELQIKLIGAVNVELQTSNTNKKFPKEFESELLALVEYAIEHKIVYMFLDRIAEIFKDSAIGEVCTTFSSFLKQPKVEK